MRRSDQKLTVGGLIVEHRTASDLADGKGFDLQAPPEENWNQARCYGFPIPQENSRTQSREGPYEPR